MVRRASPSLIRFNRGISWFLVIFAVVLIVSGYTLSRSLFPFPLIQPIHLFAEIVFITLLIIHLVISLLIPSYWRNLFRKIRSGKATMINWLKLGQRLSGWTIIIFALLVIAAGLNWYGLGSSDLLPFSQHVNFDLYLTLLIVTHVILGAAVALRRFQIKGTWPPIVLISLLFLSTLFIVNFDLTGFIPSPDPGSDIPTYYYNYPAGYVTIYNDTFRIEPDQINTTRPDLFKPGQFSAFDILAWLDKTGQITMDYTFDATRNTHIIESLNGHPYWWYGVLYEGGWPERNVFRMDHYPWKENAALVLYHSEWAVLQSIYREWRNEVTRRNENNGTVIIPTVMIDSYTFSLEFHDVEVTPHNLRNESLQDGVITAIDVIMSLGDQGLINYTLQWMESIGRVQVVRSYWVQSINNDTAVGGCGYVYEAGSFEFLGRGNHIHLPSDMRILNSPDYEMWFWICL